ncbi:hypothetical protein K458DRAFT_403401 [Lentithecium fluviatile CBS 122367]|uniref:Uncharacterized protein n=1 Tax=Lentithecium fluviatile CBS 122367 TaxID=1168545 RepID=A0A6G1J3T2_9PLEO|nr:hypothetical protein K458DRAFT_403401 [Lentithecium fluviatile CBS 122367]
MRSLAIPLLLFVFFSLSLAFPSRIPHVVSSFVASHPTKRQVGDGVTGNQTGNTGSVSGDGVGDGNGVGFAGTGNDIDTGDDFDIGDGNNTIGNNNTIEIGDRITTINMPLNISDMMERGMLMASSDGVDMSVDISVRMRIGNVSGNGTFRAGGK